MKIWAVVYDPSYTLVLSDGPIYLNSASITRGLDELPRVNISVRGDDIRALRHIQSRRVLEIYAQEDTSPFLAAIPKVFLGAFVIDNMTMNPFTYERTLQGTGTMLILKDTLTLPGLTYDDQTLENIYNGVNGLAQKAGWTASVEPGVAPYTMSVRFDGTNVFKAMQVVAEAQGVHLREGSTGTSIDVGVFGQVVGRAEYIEGDTGESDPTSLPILFDRLEMVEDSSSGDFANWILVYGAGQGDARLSLEKSTRPGKITVNDGSRDHYILKDDNSIFLYGTIQKVVSIKRIAPVGTSETQIINAANALHDAGQAWLDRHNIPQEVLRASLVNVNTSVKAGDKLRVIYSGVVYKGGSSAPFTWRDINADYWVMSVSETYGTDGKKLEVELSTLDRSSQNAVEILVGMVEAIEVNNIGVQPYPVRYPFGPYQQAMDDANSAKFPFTIDDAVLRMVACNLTLRRQVFTSTSKGAASGGGEFNVSLPAHSHVLFANLFNTSDLPITRGAAVKTESGATGSIAFYTTALPVNEDIITFEAGGSGTASLPNHTHPAVYGIYRDDVANKFIDVTVKVDGTTVATELFPTTGSEDVVTLDITQYLIDSPGGFRGNHEVEVLCTAGQGEVLAEILLDVEIGTVRTT